MPVPPMHRTVADALELAEMPPSSATGSAALIRTSSPPPSPASSAQAATISPGCAPTWPGSSFLLGNDDGQQLFGTTQTTS
jgi:hypothetical protein